MVGRYATLGLIAGQGVTNWSFRNGIPAWIPFVVSSLQFTDVERALLMASFFPGYLLTQIPGAALIQKYGAKAVLLVDMAGTSVLCLLAPLAAASSARALAGLLTVMGLFQGPLIPAIQVLKRSWLPDGPEKALVLRFMSLPFVLSEVLALTVYPWLSVNFGWRAMPICHGVSTGIYALAWLALVKDEPGSELLAAEAQEKQESTPAEVQEQEQEPRRAQTLDAAVAPDSPPAPANGTTEKRPTASTVEWRVFTVPSVIVCTMAKVGTGVLGYALEQWLPYVFVEQLGGSPLRLAFYMFWKNPTATAIDFFSGWLEGLLLRRSVPLLRIRKCMTLFASTGQSAFGLLFGLTGSPLVAALCFNAVDALYGIHHSGFSSNLLEVGGEDTAIINAVSNTLTNLPGFLVPLVGVLVRRLFGGSLFPLFAFGAAFQLATGLAFAAFASVRPARELLAERDRRRRETGV